MGLWSQKSNYSTKIVLTRYTEFVDCEIAMTKFTKDWREVKAKITIKFGSVQAAARGLECSTEAIRLAVNGKAPRVLLRLQKALEGVRV